MKLVTHFYTTKQYKDKVKKIIDQTPCRYKYKDASRSLNKITCPNCLIEDQIQKVIDLKTRYHSVVGTNHI